MDLAVSVSELAELLRSGSPPALIDVRNDAALAADLSTLPYSSRRLPGDLSAWSHYLEPWRLHVLFCAHGGEVSRTASAQLRDAGIRAVFLEGGMDAWRHAGPAMATIHSPTTWVTRERPKIDRVACPWLVRRFIDANAKFMFVPTEDVFAVAKREGATPFDIPGAAYSHDGTLCSFDTFIAKHHLSSPALDALANIVRGADTARLDLAAQSAGLLAVSLGLSRMLANDHEMLHHGLIIYDALYAWCVDVQGEPHNWTPKT